MKTLYLLISLFFLPALLSSQTISIKLNEAVKKLEADSQMKNGIVGFYVINTKTGKVIFDRNANIGLAAASSQKVITSATAFELLGINYRYKTELGFDGKIDNAV